MTSKKKLEGGSGGGSGGSTNYVQPISSSSSSATMKRYGKGAGENSREIFRKGPWTPEEDALLMQYVKRHGERHWNSVQKTGLMRCGKSCRLRWTNHLRPDLKKGSFTPEEERIVLDLHHKLGNKWSKIAAQLPGRTDNEVKNFWNTKIKRKMRARLLYNNTQQQQPEQKTEPLSQQQQQSPNHINPNPSSSSSDHTVNPSTTPDLFSPSNNSNSFLNRIHTVNSTQDPILSFLNNPVYNKYNLFSNADEDFHHQQQNWSDPFQFSSSGISRFHLSPQSSPSANYFNPTPFLTTPSTQFDYGLSVPPTVSNNLFHSDSSKPAPTQGTMKMKMGSDENIFTELPSFQIDPMITMAAVPTTTTNTTANYAMSSPLPNLSNSSGYVYSNERGNDQYRDYTAGMMIGGDRFAFLHHDEGLKEVCRDGIFDGIDQLDHGYSSGSSGVMGNQSFYGSASSPLLSTSEVKLKKDLMEGIETMDDDELRNLLDTFSSFEPSIDWFHHTNATTLTTIGGGGLNMGDAIILENSHHEDDIAGAVTTTAPSSTGLAIAADHHHLQWNEGGCDWSNMPGMR